MEQCGGSAGLIAEVSSSAAQIRQVMFSGSKIRVEPGWGRTRQFLACLIGNNLFEGFMGLVIACSICLAIVEADRRAHCEDDISPECPANFADIQVPNRVILGVYILEVLLRIAIFQNTFLHHTWNIFDVLVVLVCIASELPGAFMEDALFIRIFRLLRMVRILKLLTVFNELYLMLAGIGTTMRTIFWACIMLLVVLTITSIMAVEVLHPVNVELTMEGHHHGCARCPVAYSSVAQSMVTFLQTLVMGDGISEVFVPLIERDLLAGAFLLSTTAVVYLGFSNLILSVIVEKASEARSSDAKYKSMRAAQAKEAIKRELIAIWQGNADPCGSSTRLTLQAIKHRFNTCTEFRNYFRSLDMDVAFLENSFKYIDVDQSGDCSVEEFAEWVAKVKNTDTGALVVVYMEEVVSQLRGDITSLCAQVKALSASQATAAYSLPDVMLEKARTASMKQAYDGPSSTKPASAAAPIPDPDDSLVSMVQRAYDGPASRHLALERQFQELHRTLEAQLSAVVGRTLQEFGEQSRMELFTCGT